MNLQGLRDAIREGLVSGPSTEFDPEEIKRQAGRNN